MANARHPHHLLIVYVFIFVFTKTSYSLTRTSPSTQEELIICDKDGVANRAPFIVAIEKNGTMICVGSILSENWVLVPGHCYWLLDQRDVTLVAGGPLSGWDASSIQKRSINYYVIHDLYSDSTKAYDIGLVYTATPFTWSRAVDAINLPAKDTTPTGNAISYGYPYVTGYTTNLEYHRLTLQTVTVPIISQESCQSAMESFSFRFGLNKTHICTTFTNTTGSGGGGVGICNTDCRGPLTQQINNQNVLIGIVSAGPRECNIVDYPSVYEMVSSQISWINDHQVVPSSSDLFNV